MRSAIFTSVGRWVANNKASPDESILLRAAMGALSA